MPVLLIVDELGYLTFSRTLGLPFFLSLAFADRRGLGTLEINACSLVSCFNDHWIWLASGPE